MVKFMFDVEISIESEPKKASRIIKLFIKNEKKKRKENFFHFPPLLSTSTRTHRHHRFVVDSNRFGLDSEARVEHEHGGSWQ